MIIVLAVTYSVKLTGHSWDLCGFHWLQSPGGLQNSFAPQTPEGSWCCLGLARHLLRCLPVALQL